MRKTGDFFKQIRDTKGLFYTNMGTITDKNGMDLTEEDIKKRQQKENTEELFKKDLSDPDNHDDVITHPEPDVRSAKSSGPQEASLRTKVGEVMEFQLSYFKSLKMML